MGLIRGIFIETCQVAVVTACFFVSTALALQCYNCPYKSDDPKTSNSVTCVGDYKGKLMECSEEVKDPRCVSVTVTIQTYNATMRGCWPATAIPSDLECGVMKVYNYTSNPQKTDICVCDSDGCIPEESSKSFSNWVHQSRQVLKVVIVIFVLALN